MPELFTTAAENKEETERFAMMTMAMFQALLDVGFSRDQAFKILLVVLAR